MDVGYPRYGEPDGDSNSGYVRPYLYRNTILYRIGGSSPLDRR